MAADSNQLQQTNSPPSMRERERCNIKRSWKNNSGKSWNIATAASHRTVQTPSEVPWRVSWVTLWDASQCICFSEIIMLWEATIHKLSNWAASPCCPMRKSSHSQSMYDRWARACGKGSWTGFPNRTLPKRLTKQRQHSVSSRFDIPKVEQHGTKVRADCTTQIVASG